MGYLSCSSHSAIATCDPSPSNWDTLLPRTKHSIHQFDYSLLHSSISPQNLLGKGSYGSVYLLHLKHPKLKTAAVKVPRRSQPSSAADNEIEILSTIHHPRIVNLLGFSINSSTSSLNRKLIVVEYMKNGSLHDLLHGSGKPLISWAKRTRFMLQIARAVLFLHESDPPIIHRDIKSSNVLIDSGFNCRLSDFGLALRGHVEDVRVKCTPPAGTLGYLDPSYLLPADLSSKLDVFSFGILMMEIISGRKAIDVGYSPPSVVDWAVPAIRSGDFSGICDPRIGVFEDVEVLAVLAGRCVRSKAEKRPEMREVVECLKGVCRRMKRRVYRGGCFELGRVVVDYEPLEEANVRRGRRCSSSGGGRGGGDNVSKTREIMFLASAPSVSNDNGNRGRTGLGRSVMMPMVSKSRSMGVIQGRRMMITGSVGVCNEKLEESGLLAGVVVEKEASCVVDSKQSIEKQQESKAK